MIELVKAQCKFCHKPLVLRIDAACGDLDESDPFNVLRLLPMIACTQCADFRIRRRNIVEGLRIASFSIKSAKPEDKLMDAAERLLKAYVRLVCEWVKLEPVLDWDAGILDTFCSDPAKLGNVLNMIWRLAKQKKAELPKLL